MGIEEAEYKGSVKVGRVFRAGKYVRSLCSWIFHKGKGEQPGTNKNRTKELESEEERSCHSIRTYKRMSGIEWHTNIRD